MLKIVLLVVSFALVNVTSICAAPAPPVITGILPASKVVSSNDVLTLFGKNFSRKVAGAETRVVMKCPEGLNEPTKIYEMAPETGASDSFIVVKMSDAIDCVGSMSLLVSADANSQEVSFIHEASPRIATVSADKAKAGDIVTITGDGFVSQLHLPLKIIIKWAEAGANHVVTLDPLVAPSKEKVDFTMPLVEYPGELGLAVVLGDRKSNNVKISATRRNPVLNNLEPKVVVVEGNVTATGTDLAIRGSDGKEVEPQVILRWEANGTMQEKKLSPASYSGEKVKVAIPDLRHKGEVRLAVATDTVSNETAFVLNPKPLFLSFEDYQGSYGYLFFRMNLGVEFTTIESTLQKGLPRLGLHLYGVHSSFEGKKKVGGGKGAWGLGVHLGLSAFLTGGGEEVKNDAPVPSAGSTVVTTVAPPAPESLGDKRALEAETQLFLPIYATEAKTQLIGPITVGGSRKADESTKADFRYYGGIRIARNPLMYADFLYGKTESRKSKRLEVRGQFPLLDDNVFLGAVGNFGVKDRKDGASEDVVRVYLAWNLAPGEFIKKITRFLDATAE